MSNINNRVELFEISDDLHRFFIRETPFVRFITFIYVYCLFSLLRRVKAQMPDKNNTLLFSHFVLKLFFILTLEGGVIFAMGKSRFFFWCGFEYLKFFK